MSSIVSSTDLDETRAALRILVLRGGALGFAGLAVVEIIASAGAFARRHIDDTSRR